MSSTLQPPNPAPDTNEDIELGVVHVSLPPATSPSPSPSLPQATSQQQHAPQQTTTTTIPTADTDSEPDGEVLALEEEIAERKATIERLKKRKEKRTAAKQRAANRRALRAQRDAENPTSSTPHNAHDESEIHTSDSDDDEEEDEAEVRQRQQREQEYRIVRGAKYMGKKTLSGLEWAGSWVVWALGMDGDYADVLAAVDRMEADEKARQQEFPNN